MEGQVTGSKGGLTSRGHVEETTNAKNKLQSFVDGLEELRVSRAKRERLQTWIAPDNRTDKTTRSYTTLKRTAKGSFKVKRDVGSLHKSASSTAKGRWRTKQVNPATTGSENINININIHGQEFRKMRTVRKDSGKSLIFSAPTTKGNSSKLLADKKSPQYSFEEIPKLLRDLKVRPVLHKAFCDKIKRSGARLANKNL